MAPTATATATPTTDLLPSYTVGIVGATGAVGKEIRSCLEARRLAADAAGSDGAFNVGRLRVFGSERSAGTTIPTGAWGAIEVEAFDVDRARECDVVFLAVDGDFALKYARAICEGEGGAVVIDNSVSAEGSRGKCY
jgi:aspartate-semialdehyde dehydrogenase